MEINMSSVLMSYKLEARSNRPCLALVAVYALLTKYLVVEIKAISFSIKRPTVAELANQGKVESSFYTFILTE